MSVSTNQVRRLQFLECRARVLDGGGGPRRGRHARDAGRVDAAAARPPDADEGFYVLEGELTLFQPNGEITLGEGDFFLAARGIPHTYRVGDRDARCLILTSHAGFDTFVRAVADLDAPSPDRVTAIAAAHGIEILGPPGMLPSDLGAQA